MPRPPRQPTSIASYLDPWIEKVSRIFRGAIDALPAGRCPQIDDYGAPADAPERSAAVPPWTGRVRGAFVACGTTGSCDEFTAWLSRGEVPTVIVGGIPNDLGIPSVYTDVEELGRLAAGHLATECGCRSFLHVGLANSVSSGERHDAFARALGDLSHHCENLALTKGRYGEDAFDKKSPIDDRRFQQLLRELPRPIGILALNDAYAIDCLATCERLGLRVPDDVAVLGVDNSIDAHVHRPRLSSIRPPLQRLGAEAMRLLLRMMKGEEPPKRLLVGGMRLFARESTVGPREARPTLTVDAALERMRSQACRGITVREIADQLEVSPRTLELLFRDEIGTPPTAEIHRLRFAEASRLLKRTTMPMGRIAAVVGFADATAFSRFFRKFAGVSPREHRAGAGGRRSG